MDTKFTTLKLTNSLKCRKGKCGLTGVMCFCHFYSVGLYGLNKQTQKKKKEKKTSLKKTKSSF